MKAGICLAQEFKHFSTRQSERWKIRANISARKEYCAYIFTIGLSYNYQEKITKGISISMVFLSPVFVAIFARSKVQPSKDTRRHVRNELTLTNVNSWEISTVLESLQKSADLTSSGSIFVPDRQAVSSSARYRGNFPDSNTKRM